MTDDSSSYPAEWDRPPDESDPRLGRVLHEWQPNAAERALTAELVYLYVSRLHTFETMFLNFCGDHYRDKSWPQALLAVLELFAQTAIGSQGEQLAIARLESDVTAARDDITRFEGLS